MAEALSSYDTLVLEKKWITHDPKTVAFSTFMSKASALSDRHGNKGGGDSKYQKPNKKKNAKGGKNTNPKYEFKHVAPKA